MKIVHEKVDGDSFIELSISEKELDSIKDYMIISKKCYIKDEETFIGVKLELEIEDSEEYEELFE